MTTKNEERRIAERVSEWKEHGEPLTVSMLASTGARGRATVYRQRVSDGRRAARAIGGLAACWALAAVSVFVPVAHFVLVPLFVAVGPIVAWVRFRQRSLILGGHGPCPACGEEVVVDAQGESWPLWASCAACRARLDAQPE